MICPKGIKGTKKMWGILKTKMHGPFAKEKFHFIKGFKNQKCLARSFREGIFLLHNMLSKTNPRAFQRVSCGVEKGLYFKWLIYKSLYVGWRGWGGRDEWGKKPLQKLKQEFRWRVLDDDCEHWPLAVDRGKETAPPFLWSRQRIYTTRGDGTEE